MGTVQRSISLEDTQWKEVDTLARVLHTSGSTVLRNMVDFWQKNHDPQNPFAPIGTNGSVEQVEQGQARRGQKG